MTNTQLRIVSALVLLGLVLACLWFGFFFTVLFIGTAGVLIIDEIVTNFFKRKRFKTRYFLAQALFVVPFLFFNLVEKSPGYDSIFINAAIVVNILLMVFLFRRQLKPAGFTFYSSKYSPLTGLFILLPMMALTSLLSSTLWRELMAVLLLINFGMDTGAWFFGRKFGKHKLWPAVSPNKTIEGLIGGIFVSSIAGSLCWWAFISRPDLKHFAVFAVLGLLSQIGDLIQSKIKRFFEIKDSSSLIPGHGGVYDRLDSLLFLTPFFALALAHLN